MTIEVKLGVVERHLILENLESFLAKGNKKKQIKMLDTMNTMLSINKELRFSKEEEEEFEISYEDNGFKFNQHKNKYITYEFPLDILVTLYDRLYNRLISVYDVGTLEAIFKSIKDEYTYKDVKEFEFKNFIQLENTIYMLEDSILLNDGDPNKWIESLDENNIDVEFVKNIIRLISYLKISYDDYELYGIELVKEDEKVTYKTPEDFVYEVNLPTDVIKALESDFSEKVGLNMATYHILHEVLGFWDENKRD